MLFGYRELQKSGTAFAYIWIHRKRGFVPKPKKYFEKLEKKKPDR